MYFQQRPNATGRKGIHPQQKCTMALRQLAYGGCVEQFDEYMQIVDTTRRKCFKKLCHDVIVAFGDKYMRKPAISDCAHLVQMHEEGHGFHQMLGSIDCMHWTWKNCPMAWDGAHNNHKKGFPMVILEAVVSCILRFHRL